MRERTRIEPLIDRCESRDTRVLDMARAIVQFVIHPGKALDSAISEISAGMGVDTVPPQVPDRITKQ